VRLLIVGIAALLLAAPAAASERHPTQGELESELMCPICQGETLAQSDSPAAQRIKAYVARRIAAGDTRSEIKDKLVAQWGQRILAAPPRHGFDLLAWVLPLAGLIGAVVIMGLLAWRWTRAREPAPVPRQWALDGHPLDPEDERRLDDELRRFDG
jgi:cytochrome c-type biogenesis protein CcmH